MCEHAYRSTRHKLWRNRSRIGSVLERHGMRLRTEVLEEPERDLGESVRLPEPRRRSPWHLKDRLDKTLAQIESIVAERSA